MEDDFRDYAESLISGIMTDILLLKLLRVLWRNGAIVVYRAPTSSGAPRHDAADRQPAGDHFKFAMSPFAEWQQLLGGRADYYPVRTAAEYSGACCFSRKARLKTLWA